MRTTGILRTENSDDAATEAAVRRAATITKSRAVGILATPATQASHSYAALKRRWIADLIVVEPDCHNWTTLIERGLSHHIDIEVAVAEITRWQADVILVANSRYSLFKSKIEALAGPSVVVLDAYKSD